MTISIETIKQQLEKKFAGLKSRIVANSILLEDPKDLSRVALFLKDDPDLRMDYLSSVTAVDFLDHLESVYHLYSIEKKHGPVVLRVRVTRENPKVPSLVPIYSGAEYQEREAYDTFGIIYEGHPDPRRLFMWESFEGYPLRKDYQQEDQDTLETKDIEWLEAHGVAVPNKLKEKAKELAASGKKAIAEKPVQPRQA